MITVSCLLSRYSLRNKQSDLYDFVTQVSYNRFLICARLKMENFNTLLYFYLLSLFLNNNIDFFVCIRQFQKSGKYNVCNATVKTKRKKGSDKNTERGRQKEEKKEKQETEDTDKKT